LTCEARTNEMGKMAVMIACACSGSSSAGTLSMHTDVFEQDGRGFGMRQGIAGTPLGWRRCTERSSPLPVRRPAAVPPSRPRRSASSCRCCHTSACSCRASSSGAAPPAGSPNQNIRTAITYTQAGRTEAVQNTRNSTKTGANPFVLLCHLSKEHDAEERAA
jgi:hypothetical protein